MTINPTKQYFSNLRKQRRENKLTQEQVDIIMIRFPKFDWGKETRKPRTPAEWLVVAEPMAKDNGGKLPTRKWLATNGYSGLERATRFYPDVFNHICPERTCKTIKEWVKVADKLAKENIGILPNHKWLNTNGYSGLNYAINSDPASFSHIPRSNKPRSPQEWYTIAVKLSEGNGGKLQAPYWLVQNGYSGLASSFRTHPSVFCGMSQELTIKTPAEWVVAAEDIAKDNGGFLPFGEQLCRSGFQGLVGAMRRIPHLFQHIPQCLVSWNKWDGTKNIKGFRGGTLKQRRALEKKYGLKLGVSETLK